MSNVLLRIFIIKEDKEYNVLFDDSFSFNDNFRLLGDIVNYDFSKSYVYDKNINVFLNKDKLIRDFNIPNSRTLYIY